MCYITSFLVPPICVFQSSHHDLGTLAYKDRVTIADRKVKTKVPNERIITYLKDKFASMLAFAFTFQYYNSCFSNLFLKGSKQNEEEILGGSPEHFFSRII